MDCIICDRKFEKNILYENDDLIIMLAIEPSVNGHIQIFSKRHYVIMEQAPENDINLMISAANKLSMILFEALKVHGTNIIINNGVPAGQKIPHFAIDVLPRRTDDNLKLDWALKQAAPETLDAMQRIIGEGMNTREPQVIEDKTSSEVKHPPELKSNPQDITKPVMDEEDEPKQKEEAPDKKTNYYHQLFERIP